MHSFQEALEILLKNTAIAGVERCALDAAEYCIDVPRHLSRAGCVGDVLYLYLWARGLGPGPGKSLAWGLPPPGQGLSCPGSPQGPK